MRSGGLALRGSVLLRVIVAANQTALGAHTCHSDEKQNTFHSVTFLRVQTVTLLTCCLRILG